jgi:hypothetical protein
VTARASGADVATEWASGPRLDEEDSNMRRSTGLGIGIAIFCATAVGGAQTPTERPQTSQPQTQRQGQDQREGQTVTLVGCVQEEKNVPGRQPNAAGTGDDFILTNATMQSGGSTGGSATGGTASGATSGTTSGTASGTTSGTASGTTAGTASGTTGGGATARSGMSGAQGNMYQISGLDKDKLRQHVGQRVEVVGRLEMRGSGGGTAAGAGSRPGTTGTGTSGTGTTATGTTGTGTTGTGTTATGTGTTGTGTTGTTGTGTTGASGSRPGQSDTRAQSGNQHDLPRINATSIRQVSGTCSSTQ